MAVTLNGERVLTDANGRYLFRDVAPGSYTLDVLLPAGLSVQLGPVVVSAGRGAAVGIGAVNTPVFSLFLPLVMNKP